MDDDQFTDNYNFEAPALVQRRHAAFFALSAAFHAVLIAVVVLIVPAVQRPHNEWVLAYLVEFGNGGAGAAGAHPASGAARTSPHRADVLSPVAGVALRHVRKHPRRTAPIAAPPATEVASIAPVSTVTPSSTASDGKSSGADASRAGAASAMVASLGGAGGGGMDHAGAGSGDAGPGTGAGSPGNSLAHADYGEDPPPEYPTHSRREGEQGTVTLHVLVGADGAVERVEIAQSSGFEALDDAALATVRERWRFTPARHDGTPSESWVLVPIRFALTEASANQ